MTRNCRPFNVDEIKHKGWMEGAHGIQAGHLYCPNHAKDVWEES